MKLLTQILRFWILSSTLFTSWSWAIFNGTPANVQDTLTRNIVYISVGNLGELCSGTLIEGKYILTAAHCVNSRMTFYIANPLMAKRDYKINLQKNNDEWIQLTKSRSTSHPRAIENHINEVELYSGALGTIANQLILHESYSSYDVALIELSQDSIIKLDLHKLYGLNLDSIEFKSERISSTRPINIYGFGRSEAFTGDQTSKGTPELRHKAIDPILNTTESQAGLWVFSAETQGIASGDSGGPLFIDKKLVGLTSALQIKTDNLKKSFNSYFTNFQSPEAEDYLVNAILNFNDSYTKQCSSLHELTLTHATKASDETSDIKDMALSIASCKEYQKLCYLGGLATKNPVLITCQKAYQSFQKRLQNKLRQ